MNVRPLTACLLGLALAGSGFNPLAAATAPWRQASPVSPAAVITSEGWGALEIGLSLSEINALMGPDPRITPAWDLEDCLLIRPARAPEGMSLMLMDGRLASIWLEEGSDIATDHGARVGDTAERIRAIHRDDLVQRSHEYELPPAEYLTVWSTPEPTYEVYRHARGVSFHVGTDGKVYAIAAGDYTVNAVEGCA